MKKLNKLKTQTRITVYMGENADDATFGKGVATLMRGVEETGSLYASAKRIKMAYSKAWRIVKETEAGFGFLLINRDGARGSSLTKEGSKLLVAYEDAEAKGADYIAKQFAASLDND
ncbi:MAG: LysR family transcriptional regulator [Coriobacteriia bacterium]|nr:LysR family transcriptional regulator [Coriobacteriia bacterium]